MDPPRICPLKRGRGDDDGSDVPAPTFSQIEISDFLQRCDDMLFVEPDEDAHQVEELSKPLPPKRKHFETDFLLPFNEMH